MRGTLDALVPARRAARIAPRSARGMIETIGPLPTSPEQP